MAFGTGHHETTYLMLAAMLKHDLSEKRVLDYGCGTGILSVFAAKLKADLVEAIDIQVEAIENTKEHMGLNEVRQIHAHVGTLEEVAFEPFDLVLANINRDVILATMNHLISLLNPGGISTHFRNFAHRQAAGHRSG